ncbi:MAG: hypothetical protein ACRDG6_03230 [Candidatus Limnocylindria bacterium]
MNAGRVVPLALIATIVVIGTGAALVPVPFLSLEVAGRETLHLALPADGEFEYRYRHSVYDALVDERYRVDADGMLQLEIESADRRALEYYGLSSEPELRGSTFVIPGNPEPIPRIALIVLRQQQQSVLVGARRFDLSTELGDARLVLRPVRITRLASLFAATR